MQALPSVESVQDIHDEDALLRAALRRHAVPATRGPADADVAQSSAGRVRGGFANPVARRCDPDNRRRLAEIGWWEALMDPTFDHAPLVVQGCQVVERELERAVAVPSRRLGAVLLRAVEGEAKPWQIDAVTGWLEGRVPTTMGMLEVLLYALRRGRELGLAEVEGLLAEAFRPGYAGLLATNGPALALARIRQGYRNPAAHGLDKISQTGYGEFCGLSVACDTFNAWGRARDFPPPPPDRGLLHHHLSHLPGEPDDEPPGSALASLTTSPGSVLSVRVSVERAAPARFRGVVVAPRREGTGLRVGDVVRFTVSANEPCWLALLAPSAGGGATVLLPNSFRPYRVHPGGSLYVPDRSSPECEFPLQGPPGAEEVCALATREPLPAALLSPVAEALMRVLSPGETDELAAAVEALPAEGRAVGWCRFSVEGP